MRDIVSERSLRSFNRRSGGILKLDKLVSSSRPLTRKPMKLEMISQAAERRCDF
jgi:hypothetical protein